MGRVRKRCSGDRKYKAEIAVGGSGRAVQEGCNVPDRVGFEAFSALILVHDGRIDGRAFRVFTVIDDATRLALATVVDQALPSARVIRELDQLCEVYGPPRAIRSDNCAEFLAHNVQLWAQRRDIEWRFIQPGKAAQNAIFERFNGTLRREALAASIFPSLAEAKRLVEEMRQTYNTKRPHSALGGNHRLRLPAMLQL